MESDRFWGWGAAFAEPATIWIVGGVVAVLACAPIAILLVGAEPALRTEMWRRWRSWVVIAGVLLLPILGGAGWTILGFALLGIACYREYARATGLFRERLTSACVAVGILATGFAGLDAWYGFFLALPGLGLALIAGLTILEDRPAGYIQRVGLGVFGFLLFGTALGHLGYLANDPGYRPILLLLLVAVGLNDVFAFVVGKAAGRAKLLPATSPNKTIAGALGALLLTTLLVVGLGGPVFAGTGMEPLGARIALGVLVGVLGQAGDLMLSSVKRDLGIKDTGVLIPGHGGLLDRCNSLLLVAPAAFHLIRVMGGLTFGGGARLITGG
ncbi:MAG: phosphatidate cytidylyltransferase [Alphaproteobacteria bacterium]|nr:phosphatidate cytidylyltransferase [Alphaproteobacteria bacterium]